MQPYVAADTANVYDVVRMVDSRTKLADILRYRTRCREGVHFESTDINRGTYLVILASTRTPIARLAVTTTLPQATCTPQENGKAVRRLRNGQTDATVVWITAIR